MIICVEVKKYKIHLHFSKYYRTRNILHNNPSTPPPRYTQTQWPHTLIIIILIPIHQHTLRALKSGLIITRNLNYQKLLPSSECPHPSLPFYFHFFIFHFSFFVFHFSFFVSHFSFFILSSFIDFLYSTITRFDKTDSRT